MTSASGTLRGLRFQGIDIERHLNGIAHSVL